MDTLSLLLLPLFLLLCPAMGSGKTPSLRQAHCSEVIYPCRLDALAKLPTGNLASSLQPPRECCEALSHIAVMAGTGGSPTSCLCRLIRDEATLAMLSTCSATLNSAAKELRNICHVNAIGRDGGVKSGPDSLSSRSGPKTCPDCGSEKPGKPQIPWKLKI